jgi:creatinine amidohydrolase
LTRDIHSEDKTISTSGAWGNPTLATKEKGEIGLKVLHEMIDKQLAALGASKI